MVASCTTLTLQKSHCTGIHEWFLPYMWDANSSLQNLVEFAFIEQLGMSGLLRLQLHSNFLQREGTRSQSVHQAQPCHWGLRGTALRQPLHTPAANAQRYNFLSSRCSTSCILWHLQVKSMSLWSVRKYPSQVIKLSWRREVFRSM